MKTLLLLAALLTVSLSPKAPGQAVAHRCQAAPYRQFDFWVGDWSVRNPQGGLEGDNLVTSEHDGCVLVEHWSSPDQTGVSLNFYDFRTKQWVQQWVDSFGNALLMKGGLIDGRMILEGDRLTPDGKLARERTAWYVQNDGHIRNTWDYSLDGGKTWIMRFNGIYYKRK